ncbi:peptidoglycan editing factor PgeF [Campylobacter sp. faydin G-24]|uniref:Purine nucleoside phosphorylase n=1 Tax=Campylobacter anatolicus TaxID=2829105 RepID=A0ABS5HGL9_9BACT|nr:peptidoglycan editing factor PgeF [Campylobacter anatolicus]MBR8463398.1 peptidoglycan editing factor PgeF [Campylobacter anatolicus]MBR8465251.1 peptidoglycan editing factor PgeF [Campylobacter anatolicus]
MKFVLSSDIAVAGFSSRFGGVSTGAYESLNLGYHVGDDSQNVTKNREILALSLKILSERDVVKNSPKSQPILKFMQQIHSNKVEILRNFDDELPPCDAIITNLKNIALCVMVADCSPILLIDERSQVVAAIHAGRAGVLNKICTNAINLMSSEFKCKSKDIKAFIGANIKSNCYEIGDLDLGEFNRYKNGKNFSLNDAILDELTKLGVTHINIDATCTHCDERYFSYRRDGVTGRFAGFVYLKG